MEKEAETMEKYMIREAAKQVGVEPPVLRYWEKELSLEIPKNEMGHRYYTMQEITLLRQVKYLKDQGFHLKSVRMLKNKVPKVAQMEMGKLHSLRDRLNGQLMAEAADNSEETKTTESWKEKKVSEKPEKKEGRKQTIFSVKGTPAGIPAGKVVGTKMTMVANDYRTISMEEKLEKSKEIEKGETIEKQKTQLLELELAEPKIEKEQEITRSFNVVQGGRSVADKGVPAAKEDISSEQVAETDMDKRMEQFRMIMNDIIGEALRDNNKELAKDVGTDVSERVIKEMDFMMRSQQEEEEKRYRKLDETIRNCQRSRQEAAAAEESTKKKKRKIFSFRKSGKQV